MFLAPPRPNRRIRSVFHMGRCAMTAALLCCALSARASDIIQLNLTDIDDPEVKAAFIAAANYWNTQFIGRGIGGHVVINASTPAMDGPGGTLGSAGPTQIAQSGGIWYTTTGTMQFDAADMAGMKANGTLKGVILHEMGHVLGIGTLWTYNNLYVANSGEYTGANALAAWRDEFTQPDAVFVPVELEGGGGTANGHWNENAGGGWDTGFTSRYALDGAGVGYDMRSELMTGWVANPMFVSTVTLGSFEDMGYATQGRLGLWSGDPGANSNWSNPLNWCGIVLSQGSILTFDGVTDTASHNDMTAGRSYKDILFTAGIASPDNADPDIVPTAAFTLTGNAIRLTGNIANRGANLQTILLDIGLDGASHTIDADGGDIRINGVLSAATAGAGIAKTGVRTLILGGNNTYDGLTTVADGFLRVDADNALGTVAAGTVVAAGSTLILNDVNYTAAEALTLAGTGVGGGGALVNAGTSTYAGTITLAGDATINTGADGGAVLNLNGGIIKNGATVTFTGAGTLHINQVGLSGDSPHSDMVIQGAGMGTTVHLNADSHFNGPVSVLDTGSLYVNNTLDVSAGTIRVDGTSLLGGTGVIATDGTLDMEVGSLLTGGGLGDVGTLNFTGSGARNLNGTYVFDIDYGESGLEDDFGDLLDFSGAASVNLTDFVFELGVEWNAANAGTDYAIKIFQSDVAAIGTFTISNLGAGQTVSSTDGGYTYYLRYTLVPEPAGFAMLGLGSLLLLRRPNRRRRGRHAA